MSPPELLSDFSQSAMEAGAGPSLSRSSQHEWPSEDDVSLDIGGQLASQSEPSAPGQRPQPHRPSKACAKLLVGSGLRCATCFRLKSMCSCARKTDTGHLRSSKMRFICKKCEVCPSIKAAVAQRQRGHQWGDRTPSISAKPYPLASHRSPALLESRASENFFPSQIISCKQP